MRQGNDNGIILNEQGQIVAVNLGADYCAEHEWGIRQLENKFGFNDESKFGLERRKITKSPIELLWLDDAKFEVFGRTRKKNVLTFLGLFYDGYHSRISDAHNMIEHTASYYSAEKDLISLWSESDFCVLAHKPDQVEQLREVYNAFANNDIAIWRGGGHVFKNAGLCIAIASRLSKEVTDKWYEGDIERRQLLADVLATGIEAKLKEANKKYYALSPRRKDGGSITFWLNPCEQDKNNSGWFSVQELEQWCEGTGPIPKK